MNIKQKIVVKFNYEVFFTRDLFNLHNKTLKKIIKNTDDKVIVFIDSGVVCCQPDIRIKIDKWFRFNKYSNVVKPYYLTEGGENCKNNLNIFMKISDVIVSNKMDRHSHIVIIGGGAVLDTVGFAASIAHRGIRHIRVPTTVLSQGDSGVGVKNSINFYNMKNYFGTFTPPFAVVNDFNFLGTISTRDWLSGISEFFKVAIIKDKKFLQYLAANVDAFKKHDKKILEYMVYKSSKIHSLHISKGNDPFEMGSSRPLDFGHWSAHYLEKISGYKIRHGEAVSCGIAIDMAIAKNRGLVSADEYEYVINAMKSYGLKIWHPLMEVKNRQGKLQIFNGLEEFRQHLGGKLCLVMPSHLGKMCMIKIVSYQEVLKAVHDVN